MAMALGGQDVVVHVAHSMVYNLETQSQTDVIYKLLVLIDVHARGKISRYKGGNAEQIEIQSALLIKVVRSHSLG
jgi:hypothetical protein